MPRAPSRKANHANPTAGHPYALGNVAGPSMQGPTSSASPAHSPHQQHIQQHYQIQQDLVHNVQAHSHIDSIAPQSSDYSIQQHERRHREDSGTSISKQESPRASPHRQGQPLSRFEGQRPQRQNVGQDGLGSTKKDGMPLSAGIPRTSSNGNGMTSASAPVPPSTSNTSSTTASGSGGAASKKKHICSTCDRAFTTSGHLARHARVHTGERNHKCPFPGCETRCSRQDNLQQHYRIHLSPGSRRSSSSATRAAIQRAIANPTATPVEVHSGTPVGATDLDTPPPLAQANLPPPPLAQAHVPYPSSHQPYPVPPHTSPLSQSLVPSPHTAQQSFPQTPPIPNGGAHIYENGSGLPVNVPRGYSRNQPESPAEHSGPGSATPSADASPVIGGPGTSSVVSQSYSAPPPPYLYVQQHPGYYQQSPQHTTAALHGPGSNSASYASPSPNSSGSNGHYPPPPQISTFYQQHHYPREAYINTAPPSSAPPQAETTPSYQPHTLPQQMHDQQRYEDPSKSKSRKRARSSGGSTTNGELTPSDSPVISNTQGHPNGRANGQGQSNVYSFYGMTAPPSSGSAPAPQSGGSIASAPPPPSSSSHSSAGYAVNGNGGGFTQFQLHTSPPPPPPLTSTSSSSAMTNASSVSYGSNHAYPPQAVDANGTVDGNGTHSPPPVLAPIQTKRLSYNDVVPSRYSYEQHQNHTNGGYASTAAYASVGKGYSD